MAHSTSSTTTTTENKPLVLCISGLDPSGGAGIQADIESIFYLGCHCCSIVSVLTVQNTNNFSRISPVATEIIEQQFNSIMEDMPIRVIKIGMLGSVEQINSIGKLLKQYPEIPVVIDPVFASGNGFLVSSDEMLAALKDKLLPHCFLLTPNSQEARRLAGATDISLSQCAEAIQKLGCKNVLIKGTHENEQQIIHHLWEEKKLNTYQYARLNHDYHGSGCTLASAIAALLAKDFSLEGAVKESLEFTYHSLLHAQVLGKGQLIPDRKSLSK
jgi:hydroxymethylpyrimidine/phosphomethylpyrimidine kinase